MDLEKKSIWKKWKLVRSDGTPTKEYIEKNGLALKNGTTLKLKDKKYSFMIYENGAVAVQWGYGEWYGPWTEVINHKGWEIKFK